MHQCQHCGEQIFNLESNCPSCGAAHPVHAADSMGDLEAEVLALLEQDSKIEAVRIYQERMDVGLRDAKDAVESLERAHRSRQQQMRTDSPEVQIELHVLQHLKQGDFVRAVKVYKKKSGADLREAKEAVEAIAAKHGIGGTSGGGLSAVLPWVILGGVVVFAAVAAYFLFFL